MPTLNVSYTSGKLTITGGDNNGSDVTILYGQNATITWNRVGTNFKFKGVTFSPTGGPFSNLAVADDSMSVLDNDTNTTGKDVQYEYTITVRDATGALKRFDPKVINKSQMTAALVARLAKKPAKPAKRATRTRR